MSSSKATPAWAGEACSTRLVSAALGVEAMSLYYALPHLTAMVAIESHNAGNPALGWCDSQAEFVFTLELLRDGLERLRG